jgi:ribonuclease P/MRP protein subunit RPP40
MIKDNMLGHLINNNLLDPSQHGFLPSHSTSSQLLESSYDWFFANDKRFPVDAVYLDFSKAFDSVSHSKLISKLHCFNFCNNTVNWLASFLSGRTQVVKCNRAVSSPVNVTSGVPQGSVCGPLLFVLFINDLATVCAPCSVKLYADDVKLYYTIKQPCDRRVLQNCLHRVHDWAQKWDLLFSYDKCMFLQIGYSDHSIVYKLGNRIINLCDSVSDLGVTVHSSLKFSSHCASIAAKANIRAKLILKCFLSRSSCNLIRAFKVYVRPLLEYASVVWNPWLLKDINLIENVQRRFTRNVCIKCHLPVVSYDERLTFFNLDRLELRRLKIDLVEMFKIVHGYTKCNVSNCFSFSCNNVCSGTRGHRFKLNIIRCNKNLFKYYFTNRIVHAWNSLPDRCLNTNLISTFKRNLCNINLSSFVQGQL